jgi:hypothetical protein
MPIHLTLKRRRRPLTQRHMRSARIEVEMRNDVVQTSGIVFQI